MAFTFISYESSDRTTAFKICEYLESRGLRCWIAPRDIHAGEYAGEITRALKTADNLVVVCSAQTSKSPHVRNEVSLAFGDHCKIVPFMVDDIVMDDSLEYYFAGKQRVFAKNSIDKGLQKLYEVLGGERYKTGKTEDFDFRGCTGLTSIEIPNSVTKIGQEAFYGCTGLTSIEIPDSVTRIGQEAFYGCTGLTGIEIPKSVTKIDQQAFYGCCGLKSIEIPDSVTEIGYGAFSGCTGLTSIEIPNSVMKIEQRAFYGCTELVRINVAPDNSCYKSDGNCILSKDGTRLEFGCRNSVIPNSVTEIGKEAFKDCTGLTGIVIPDSVTRIEQRAFYGCRSLSSIAIPKNVTEIEQEAFFGCTGLINIIVAQDNPCFKSDGNCFISKDGTRLEFGCRNSVIPSSVKEIGQEAFYGCTELTCIEIPDSVTEIGQRAFYGCRGLTGIEIPDSVRKIGQEAFYGCTELFSIVVDPDNSYFKSDGNCFISKDGKKLEFGCKNSVIPCSVTEIGQEAFYGCTGLTGIEIPNSVKEIGGWAFARCTGLTSIEIPNSITGIGYEAFKDCTGLTTIEIPNSVTRIGYGSFQGFTGLTKIDIPDSVKIIADWAFASCTGLSSIEIPSSVTEIGYGAFYGCTGLTRVEISKNVMKIGPEAFYGCTRLTSINLHIKEQDPKESESVINKILKQLDDEKLTLFVPVGTGYAYRHHSFVRRLKEVIIEK